MASADNLTLQHHFDDADQQADAVNLGMWFFLAQEIMFFGGLFATYAIYRFIYPEAWHLGSHHLDITLGCFNTGVLIGSSLTMALVVHASAHGKRGQMALFMVATMILGAIFLGVKAIEYHHKYVEHLIPGTYFGFDKTLPMASQQQLFFALYFAMTGMHALHMVIGMGIMVVLLYQIFKAKEPQRLNSRMEVMGLYWHFVDIIWIFLFPLLYLIGRHA